MFYVCCNASTVAFVLRALPDIRIGPQYIEAVTPERLSPVAPSDCFGGARTRMLADSNPGNAPGKRFLHGPPKACRIDDQRASRGDTALTSVEHQPSSTSFPNTHSFIGLLRIFAFIAWLAHPLGAIVRQSFDHQSFSEPFQATLSRIELLQSFRLSNPPAGGIVHQDRPPSSHLCSSTKPNRYVSGDTSTP